MIVSAGIRYFLLLAYSQREEESAAAFATLREVREEWFRALARDRYVAGFLHCGEHRPSFADISEFLQTGRMVMSDAARQVMPAALTESFGKLGFLETSSVRRMKVFVLKGGWTLEDRPDEGDTAAAAVQDPQVTSSAMRRSGTLLRAVESLIGRRSPNQQQALRARLGLEGARRTLADAGALVGVTRERVRQLEERLYADLMLDQLAMATEQALQSELAGRSSPLWLSELSTVDPWFDGVDVLPEFIRAVIPSIAPDLQVLDIEGGAVICRTSVPAWATLIEDCRTAAEQLVATGATLDDVRQAIERVAAEAGGRELAGIANAVCSGLLHFSSDGALIGFGVTQPDIVESILRDSDTPLHYSEVARRWATRTGEHVDALQAHRALGRSESARLLGRGIYGVDQHLPIAEGLIEPIVADAEFIVLNASTGRQWHASEILAVLGDLRPDLPDTLDKYSLSVYLDRSKVLRSVGRLVWCRNDEAAAEYKRIDLRDAAIEALERANGPLSESALRAEIVRSRGVDRAYFCLVPTRELAKVSPGIWGLFPRDFHVNEDECAAISALTFEILTARGKGLHSSEMLDVLAPALPAGRGLTGYMVQQIAGRDERINLFYGELLGLAAWPDARRLSLSGAMEQIASRAGDGLTLDDVHSQLEALTERSIPRATASTIVSQSDLVFDADARLWRRETAAERDNRQSAAE